MMTRRGFFGWAGAILASLSLPKFAVAKRHHFKATRDMDVKRAWLNGKEITQLCTECDTRDGWAVLFRGSKDDNGKLHIIAWNKEQFPDGWVYRRVDGKWIVPDYEPRKFHGHVTVELA